MKRFFVPSCSVCEAKAAKDPTLREAPRPAESAKARRRTYVSASAIDANAVLKWLRARGYEVRPGDAETDAAAGKNLYRARTSRGVVHVRLTPQGLRWAGGAR